MPDNVNFKVYLSYEDNPTDIDLQVRRFTMRKESATFPKFQEKLATLFPGVQWWLTTISWKDAEEDDVTVSTTEELRLALDHMKDEDLCKFDIVVRSSNPAGDSDCHTTESAPMYSGNNSELPTLHLDTTCDGCDSDEIRGFLYKCLQCEDYDLCADCEAKGVHPEHCMIRSAVPLVSEPSGHNVNLGFSENVTSTRITLHHYDHYNAISFE